MKRSVTIAISVLALVGLVDSLYLAKSKAEGIPLLCNIESLSGCNIVADSPYSNIFGIPLADFGVGFYILVLVLLLLHLPRALQLVAVLGSLASLYFIYLQAFVIKAACIYCILSAIATFVITYLAFRVKHDRVVAPPEAATP